DTSTPPAAGAPRLAGPVFPDAPEALLDPHALVAGRPQPAQAAPAAAPRAPRAVGAAADDGEQRQGFGGRGPGGRPRNAPGAGRIAARGQPDDQPAVRRPRRRVDGR